jgi:hypothetical protein
VCPFCAKALDLAHAPRPLLPREGLSRAALLSFRAAAAIGALGATTSLLGSCVAAYGCPGGCDGPPPDAGNTGGTSVGGTFGTGGSTGGTGGSTGGTGGSSGGTGGTVGGTAGSAGSSGGAAAAGGASGGGNAGTSGSGGAGAGGVASAGTAGNGGAGNGEAGAGGEAGENNVEDP